MRNDLVSPSGFELLLSELKELTPTQISSVKFPENRFWRGEAKKMRQSGVSPSGFVLAEFGLRDRVFAPFLAFALLEHRQDELYTKPLSNVRI